MRVPQPWARPSESWRQGNNPFSDSDRVRNAMAEPTRIELPHSRFCRSLSPDDLAQIQKVCRICHFPAGTEVFQEGDPGDGLYVILQGAVDIVSQLISGKTYILSHMEAGDYFGEMAIFDGEPRSATARVCQPLEAAFVPVSTVRELVDRCPTAAAMLVRDASLRLREFNHRFLRESLRGERLALVERLARSIAHDFRNPLSVINLAGQMAAAETASPASRQEALARIQKHIRILNQMMQELVDFTRGTPTPVVLPRVPLDGFLRDVVIDLQSEATRRGVQLVVDGTPPALSVRLDGPRFSRVFMNLAQNAFDAMSGLPHPTLTLRFHLSPTEVGIELADTGKGIDPRTLPHIFEPFFTHGKAEGTGLGLPICERIVQDHGGRITVRSEVGHGSVFTVFLPIPNTDSGAHPTIARPHS